MVATMMSRPPRITGFTYRGRYQYFLTFCTLQRQTLFDDRDVATLVIDHFLRTSMQWHFALLAYCLMPDHAHVLAEGLQEDSDLQRFGQRLKQGSAQAYAHRFHRRLWQEGYFDRVLRAEEDARAVARYIAHNPVRAGLVSTPIDDPYFGSSVWSVEELSDGL